MNDKIPLSSSVAKYKCLPETVVCAGMEKKLHFSQLQPSSVLILSALDWNTLVPEDQIRNLEDRRTGKPNVPPQLSPLASLEIKGYRKLPSTTTTNSPDQYFLMFLTTPWLIPFVFAALKDFPESYKTGIRGPVITRQALTVLLSGKPYLQKQSIQCWSMWTISLKFGGSKPRPSSLARERQLPWEALHADAFTV